MAYRTNRRHYFLFRVLNSGTPVTGLTIGNFSTVLLMDGVVSGATLSLTEVTTGLYSCSYVPIIPGFYYLELYNSTYTTRISDSVEIDSTDTFFGINNTTQLTQNYGSTDRFKVTVSSPETYTLFVYKSSDWIVGNTSILYVVNSTAINTSGNWVTTSLSVAHETYHIVIKDLTSTIVLASFLVV